MLVIGVTGGVGMGKSTCAQLLAERGIPVIDTDILAREVVQPGQPALAEIAAAFGPELIGSDGQLRRDELASRVFANTAERQKLESILHPRIRQKWLAQLNQWRSSDGKNLAAPGERAKVTGEAVGDPFSKCAVIIPLLFETHAETEFDTIICIACSASTQRQRLAARGWSPEQIDQRIAAQWPTEKKITLSNFVIWTDGPVEIHAAQLDLILQKL
jgi:dephospho-CoA kinase